MTEAIKFEDKSQQENLQPVDDTIKLYLKNIEKMPTLQDKMITGRNIFGKITPREIETLYWAANGLSAKTTAGYLNMSVHTIHSYRKSVIRKLSANSITQAVYIACQKGFI